MDPDSRTAASPAELREEVMGGAAEGDVTEKVEEEKEEAAEGEVEAQAKAEQEALTAQRQLLTVKELIQTERSYLRSLELCTGTIRRNLHLIQPPLDNLDSMFLHIDGVIDMSRCLLSLLEQTEVSDPDFLRVLCEAFLSLRSDMEKAYKEYLANYNIITSLENSYKQKEALWPEIVMVIKSSAPEVNASSLTFFLVMPVQRIARYPLLLQTIQKHTDPTHPAYPALEHAFHIAVEMNCNINEYKRFREVADKYKKTETLTIIDKMNRLTGHSIAKKTARLSQYIKVEAGIVPKLKDEEFDVLQGFFCVLERGVVNLHENVIAFLTCMQLYLQCRPEEHDLDIVGDKAAVCYKEISTALREWIYPTFEHRVQTLVCKPLCSLRELLQGPRNLIRKRMDKLLDFEALGEKSNLSYEEQEVATAYRTINALLLAELPSFNATALQLLWGALGTFSCLHRDLAADVEQLFASYTNELPHSQLKPSAFWEWAEGCICEQAERLDGLIQSIQDDLKGPIVQPLSPTSQRRLKILTDKFGPSKIYQLTGHVTGGRELDLTLQRGELVALMTEMDTRGDRRRWLVDAGGPRGYVPSAMLVHYHQVSKDSPLSPHIATVISRTEGRRHSYTPLAQPARTVTTPYFQVVAGYDFTARSRHEVTLQAGEPVRLLESHDKRGNPEWSLVEVRGQRGYVPSSYLTMVPSSALQPSPPYC
ncbi:rho guanine nucleotide exchange factor 37 isoform X1 [Paramormyrops kingsleyae]|uniref:Rho guanine nucleotide exchange factor 37 n=1 Tax=Paramormyrops kingsleyae TaxID=1676925 RepID=A0A3B3Q4J8_9TELE|nr:rho guanine nucleotide exchange factor 37 isoform X1 [Paramormyrops kingsleyae]XP_023650761.1 rho guanine nucleotide exchange factor 37 isoform X1 [Paramormyrops kingsleyae]XP_023650762.1 rho guanine nucleotide exchange factor 37 isoform X1 [Paramormyrops kingsleyae]